jgi:hypothetical protein
MPSGGKRRGAGRPKGARNRVKVEAFRAAAATGELPVEYLLRIMRDPDAGWQRQDAAAAAAAPYLHPKLSSIEHSGEIARPTVIRAPSVAASVDEWQAEYVPPAKH